jgi:UDP-N-acetylglucosamine 2-epimerase (non-hydrolysing)
MVSGLNAMQILQSVHVMVNQEKTWSFPEGYTDMDVSDRVVKFLLGGIALV